MRPEKRRGQGYARCVLAGNGIVQGSVVDHRDRGHFDQTRGLVRRLGALNLVSFEEDLGDFVLVNVGVDPDETVALVASGRVVDDVVVGESDLLVVVEPPFCPLPI